MSKILQKIEENERMFERRFGELQVIVDNQKIADVVAASVIKSFLRVAQLSLLDEIKQAIGNLITDEILVCHHENTPTSRLTSLAMKIRDLLDTKPCGCACHDSLKPFEHSSKCCEFINGIIYEK